MIDYNNVAVLIPCRDEAETISQVVGGFKAVLPNASIYVYDNCSTDDTQKIAKDYDAVCTPDFFGYNKNLELQYRGRIRELKDLKPIDKGDSDLRTAMKLIASSGKGPAKQIPSMGCNIKWFK